MENKFQISFDPLIIEAEGCWRNLQHDHRILRAYPNCKQFYNDIKTKGKQWRARTFFRLRSACQGRITHSENSIFILLFHQELLRILRFKSTIYDRENTWATIVTSFLECIHSNSMNDFDNILRLVSNAVKRWKDREKRNRERIKFLDIGNPVDIPITPNNVLEFEEFIEVLLKSGTNANWIHGLLTHLSLSGSIKISARADIQVTDYQIKKSRDIIAAKIEKDLPELARFTKKRQVNRKRRSCLR
ncbi:MAG: hypothetical protein LUG50_12905 [Planctomycetaceae bacterium]|nr:hypothetical protein [Planctomycetaceae bacterium]